MSKKERGSLSIHGLLPTEVDGFDSLAELALDLHWAWNHRTDGVWRLLTRTVGSHAESMGRVADGLARSTQARAG